LTALRGGFYLKNFCTTRLSVIHRDRWYLPENGKIEHMITEALHSAMRFTMGFATIVGVSAGLTLAVNHLAAQAPNNDKAIASPAAVGSLGPDALGTASAPVADNISFTSEDDSVVR